MISQKTNSALATTKLYIAICSLFLANLVVGIGSICVLAGLAISVAQALSNGEGNHAPRKALGSYWLLVSADDQGAIRNKA
jgi:hypothetical protein